MVIGGGGGTGGSSRADSGVIWSELRAELRAELQGGGGVSKSPTIGVDRAVADRWLETVDERDERSDKFVFAVALYDRLVSAFSSSSGVTNYTKSEVVVH